jgi:hypothetical protein
MVYDNCIKAGIEDDSQLTLQIKKDVTNKKNHLEIAFDKQCSPGKKINFPSI